MMYPWKDLLIAPLSPSGAERRIVRECAGARLVYWDGSESFLPMLAAAAKLAERVFVHDPWLGALAGAPGFPGEPQPLGRFDPALGRIAGRAASLPERPAAPALFCPSSDTHCRMFAPVAGRLQGSPFLDFKSHEPHENVARTMKILGLESVVGGAQSIGEIQPGALVLANDWNCDSTALIDSAWTRRIPSVCVQEGCVEFFDNLSRMQRCHYPFMQGPAMLGHLNHEAFFLTGNPRFDELRPAAPPPEPRIMLNCNFTYGVQEQARGDWIRAAAEVCRARGAGFFISQHPRDGGEFPGLPVETSGALSVSDQLARCSILVTRFSTLVYEAMLMGRPCIYYNPHGEEMGVFENPPGRGFFLARDAGELAGALAMALEQGVFDERSMPPEAAAWLEAQCGPRDGRAAERVASAIGMVLRRGGPLPLMQPCRPLSRDTQRLHMRLPRPLRNAYRRLRGLPSMES